MSMLDKLPAGMVGKFFDNLLRGSIRKLKDNGAPDFQLVILPEYENECFIGYVYKKQSDGKYTKSAKMHSSDLVKFLNEVKLTK